jgi:glycosyltransferase involved in cell wall biosynthesis
MNNNKPKILIVGPLPPPNGGVATAVSNILNSDLRNEFRLMHVSSSNRRSTNKKGKMDILNVGFLGWQIIKLISAMIVFRPCIVQIESSCGISFLKNSIFVILARIAGRKIILSIYGETFENFYQKLPPIRQKYVKFVLNSCNKIKIESQGWRDFFVEKIGINASDICIIPNAVFLPDEVFRNRDNDLTGEKLKLLFLGVLKKKKGIFDFLKSIKILKDKGYNFKAEIVGPEGERGEMEKVFDYIEKESINEIVGVHGEKQHNEVGEFYSVADIYLLPSYTEGFPYAILEAMAYGLPIISTKVGGIPELIEDGVNGFLVDPGDADALAEKIEILMGNKKLREIMGKNNREKIKNKYSMDKQVEKIKNIYNILCVK